MAAVVINGKGKRMKEQDDDDNESLSHSNNKKARVVWSNDLHTKFVDAVNELVLGQQRAVPSKIAALMNVDGITTKHVASHLQKYRLGNNKKAIHQDDKVLHPTQSQTSTQSDMVSSTLILQQPTQSQNINIHPSYNFPVNKKPLHQSDSEIYSPPGLNMSGVAAPSTLTPLIQSQNINNNSLNIHPPPSTFPPLNQTSTILLPNNMPLHQSDSEIYSPPGFNMSGVALSTLTRPIQSQYSNNNSLNIHPPPSTFPLQSQNINNNSFNIHPSYNFPLNQTSTLLRKKKVVHQSDTQIYSLPGFNMTGVAPSPLIHQPTPSQNINIHPSYNFPLKQTSTLLLPNNMPLHQSHTTLPNPEIYSPTPFNMSGLTPSTLILRPTRSQNINHSSSIIHPPPSTFPIYHQTSTFPTLANQSTTPLGFPATTLDFHDTRSRASNCPFVGSSSKSPSIWDYDWYTKYMKREPHLNNSLPESESDKTSQNSQMNSQQAEPFMDGFSSSLEDTNIDISDYNLCSENSPIDFSVEETDPNTLEDIDFSVEETDLNTLEDIRNMGRCIEDEDLINAWRCFQEEDVTNVMHQP